MKTLITALALTALLTSATFAAPRSHEVVAAGKVIGADPDVNIRSGLLRDAYVNEQ
jgi:hypothetical protein